MQKITLMLLLCGCMFISPSYANNQPFNTIQEFFAATSAFDHDKLKSFMTDDFQLLEVGQIWDANKLISVIRPSNMVRKNYFQLVTTKLHDDSAWVSYWNKAIFTNNGKSGTMYWLESAVLVKHGAGWQIQMLHSTRVDKDKVPTEVKFVEYTG
ncbi:hypothetical protein tinsulaeT_16070 [Thalassotalea insulae]|uniref:DUF4440 domain-containing protein n=1 Tax=Thalassotalea insulae TaxID=2056778 RepID=A0ABQ6GQQ1_9GAMM|nr:nuclear transport factor 2 family protein [Thalassotalea insulae]GLX78267.1 hypothetical protein tinsulaeT_16070 [Thalassotalea insulae]